MKLALFGLAAAILALNIGSASAQPLGYPAYAPGYAVPAYPAYAPVPAYGAAVVAPGVAVTGVYPIGGPALSVGVGVLPGVRIGGYYNPYYYHPYYGHHYHNHNHR